MSEWIPLFQAMLWPLCILVFIFTFRGHVLQLLRSINNRVQNGAEFEVGREIYLVDDGYGELSRVTKVVYHLHPTFRDPDRTVTDREDNFVLETVGWGMFNLTADVYSKGQDEPLRMERYLNF